jgi:hypothetical protein
MSWQLSFQPAERSRGEGASDVLRSKPTPYVRKFARQFLRPTKYKVQGDVNWRGDFGTRFPIFAPYRTWGVGLYETGLDAAQAEELRQQRQAQADAWFASQLQAENERKAAAAQARANYLQEWKAERSRRNEANPDDVWDYRNYSSLEWWKEKSQEPLNVQFALRALNVPNELLSWRGVAVGLGVHNISQYSRYAEGESWDERQTPAKNPLERIGLSTLTLLTSRKIVNSPQLIAFQLVGDVAGELADYLGTDDETYSPRQFWPPIPFAW